MGNKYKIHHGEFEITYEPLYGLSVYPEKLCSDTTEEYWIWINRTQCESDEEELDTLIHELLHAEDPNMTEEQVTRTATNIAKVLTGEGWGKLPKKRRRRSEKKT